MGKALFVDLYFEQYLSSPSHTNTTFYLFVVEQNNHHPDHHNGSDRPCYNGYDKVCVHKECDAGAGYSDNPNDACGKAWYCDDNVSVWGWDEKDFDASQVHCGCSKICYQTVWHSGAEAWVCCDDEEDKQMEKQEKMLRGAEEEKLVLKSE